MRSPVWLLVLAICQLACCEGRYWHQEGHKDVKHRHRHQHESPSRWVHQRRPLLEPDDYDSRSDSEEDESTDDEDYEFYYPRRWTPNRSPGRSHRRWQHRDQEEAPRRKSHRHQEKSRRLTSGRAYPRPEDYDYESTHRRYHHEDKLARRTSLRKHRNYEDEEQTLKRILDYVSRSESRKRKSWTNSTRPEVPSRKRNRHWEDEEEDYRYSDEDKDDENELWKEEDDDDDDYENMENDDQEKRAPLRTFEDIIKRLTSSDPTTPRTAAKKDMEIARYLKRDVYGNLQLDASLNASARGMVKSVSGPVRGKVVTDGRKRDESAQTKDPDYDEYSNADEDGSMQADINNADYAEEENAVDEEEEEQFSTSTVPSTTTTAKPIVSVQHNPRDLRFYEDPAGHQSNGYHTRTEYPPMSPHSMHKWETLGTRESVKKARGHVGQNGKSAEMREALQHAIKVMKEGSCQWPRARVIPVQELYPSVSTSYIPHCAILHRCTDDTGCCKSEALTCVPKHTQRVELYFYATNVVKRTSVVEKLTFYNHTQCECREKRLEDNPDHEAADKKNTETQSISESRKSPQRKSCRCPSLFTPKVTSKGECHCNCHEKNENCIRASRGKVSFSLTDRLCIQNETCGKPGCEFGEYKKLEGRCPRKKDRFDEIGNHHLNQRFYQS